MHFRRKRPQLAIAASSYPSSRPTKSLPSRRSPSSAATIPKRCLRLRQHRPLARRQPHLRREALWPLAVVRHQPRSHEAREVGRVGAVGVVDGEVLHADEAVVVQPILGRNLEARRRGGGQLWDAICEVDVWGRARCVGGRIGERPSIKRGGVVLDFFAPRWAIEAHNVAVQKRSLRKVEVFKARGSC